MTVEINHTLESLQTMAQLVMTEHTFGLGDLITWKPGLKRQGVPDSKLPYIVIAVFRDAPTRSDQFGRVLEPTDLLIAIANGISGLDLHYVNSRWFQPWTSKLQQNATR